MQFYATKTWYNKFQKKTKINHVYCIVNEKNFPLAFFFSELVKQIKQLLRFFTWSRGEYREAFFFRGEINLDFMIGQFSKRGKIREKTTYLGARAYLSS